MSTSSVEMGILSKVVLTLNDGLEYTLHDCLVHVEVSEDIYEHRSGFGGPDMSVVVDKEETVTITTSEDDKRKLLRLIRAD